MRKWEDVEEALRAALRAEVGEERLQAWFQGLRVADLARGVLAVSVPDALRRRRLAGGYLGTLERAAARVLGVPVRVEVRIELRDAPGPERPRTLANYLVDEATFLARASVERVLREPAGEMNPLVLHGPSGAGKSHLLQGLHEGWIQAGGEAALLTAGELERTYREAVRSGATARFRERLERGAFLLDEAHRLRDRPGTQRELARLLGTAREAGRQVVLASRHHPRRLQGFDARLLSLLLSGMVVEVSPPAMESRARLVLESLPRPVPPDIARAALRLCAGSVAAARRAALEAESEARDRAVPLTPELLEGLFGPAPPPEDAAERIEEEVARRFSVSAVEMRGRVRRRTLLLARRVALALLRELLGASYADLGRRFGGLRAPAAAAAARRGREALAGDPGLSALREELRRIDPLERPGAGR